MDNCFICYLCNNPSVKVRCKIHKVYICSSHIQTHIESNDFCEIENLSSLKTFPKALEIELNCRLNLILSMRRSILHITNSLINTIEVQSHVALNKLNDQMREYKSILSQDPGTFNSEQIDRILNSVVVKLPKTDPILILNNYYTGDFFVEKPKSSVNSDLIGTLEYLKTTWDLDIQGHTSAVLSLVYDKNRSLYSGSLDQTIKVWDWPGKNLKRTLLGHKSGVTCLEINKNNDKLVSGSSDTTIRIWCLLSFEVIKILREHNNVILGLCFTNDGKFLVSCSADLKIILWESEKMEKFNIVSEHQNWIFTVATSPDNQYLASGSRDNSINIWTLKSLSLTFTVTEHKNDVVSVLFSLDSKHLFSGSTDRTIKVWSTKDFSLLNTLTDHKKPINCLAVSENCLYSTSQDGILIIRDIKTLKIKSKFDLKKKKRNCLALDKHESLIAVGLEDEVKLIIQDSEEKIELNGHFSKIKEVFIFNYYQLAASYASDGLKIWSIIDKTSIKTCKTFADAVKEVSAHRELEKFLTYFS